MSIMHLEVEKARQVMQTLQQVLQNMEAEMERARRDVGRLQSVWQGPAAEEFFYRFQAWWKKRRTVTEDLQRLVKDGLQEIDEWVRVAERFEGGSAGSDPQSPQVFLRNRQDEGSDPWEAIPQTPVPKDGDRTVRIRAGENQGDTQARDARDASPGPAAPESGTASRGEAGGVQSQSVTNRTQTERSGAPAGSTSTAGSAPGAVAGSPGGAGGQGASGGSVQGQEMPGGRLRIGGVGGDVNVQYQTSGDVFDTQGDVGTSGSGVTDSGRGVDATDAIGSSGAVGGSGDRTVVDRGSGFVGGGGGGGGGAAIGGGAGSVGGGSGGDVGSGDVGGGVGGGEGSGGLGSGSGGAGSPGLESPDVAPDASVETPPEEMTTPMEGQEAVEDVETPLSSRGWAMLSGLGAGVLLSGAAYAVYRALRKEQPEELMDEAEATQIFPADLWDEDLEDMDDLGDEATNMSADATVADPAWASSDEQDYFRQAS